MVSANLCVSTQTPRPQDAWSLVRHLTSTENEVRFQKLIGNLPAKASAWSAPQMKSPVLRAFAEQMPYPAYTPKIVEWERIQIEVQLIAERVVRGLLTIRQGLAAIDARVDNILAKRRALVQSGRIQ
jgi:multiple sugar transport system substrate-binding protein